MAVNSFFPCGGTWSSSHDSFHRIDYICCNDDDLDVFSDVIVGGGGVDLAPGNKEDHRMVAAAASLIPNAGVRQSQRKPARLHGKRWFNLDALCVPYLREQFAWKLLDFYASHDLQVDAHLDQFKSFIRSAAVEVFGKPVPSPLKPWVSQEAWLLVARIAPLRR